MTTQYDVAVIGAGNAGLAAAKRVHEAGLSTAMIESAQFGGTCPNRGSTLVNPEQSSNPGYALLWWFNRGGPDHSGEPMLASAGCGV